MKMNAQEIVMLLIGAAISLFSSVVTLWMTDVINRTGRIRIFYRFTGLRDYTSDWGFFSSEDGGMQFVVPALFEIQNTKNTPFVIAYAKTRGVEPCDLSDEEKSIFIISKEAAVV